VRGARWSRANAVVPMATGSVVAGSPAPPAVPTGAATPAAAADSPRLELSARRVMVDQPVGIVVRGLAPDQTVRLDLVLERWDATTWTSWAVFRADRRGRVDLATTAPLDGDYQGVDPMGLLWSAQQQQASGLDAAGPEEWTDVVRVSASIEDREVASGDLVRYYLRPGTRATPVRERGLVGTIFEPRRHGRRASVIVLGGSEGGLASAEVRAALLASHGFNALALAYFDPTDSLGGGLPDHLSLIPLEYFDTAIDWLGERRSVDANRVGVVGASKGAELALLLASRDPQLKAVVAYAPSSVVWAGLGTPSDSSGYFTSSWSENGEPVTFLPYDFGGDQDDFYTGALADRDAAARAAIPAERINGPVMLVSGTDDQLWPSTYMADQVMARLREHGHRYTDRHLAYDGAGHAITFPYQPTIQVASGGLQLGGNPADTARAARDHWPRALRFLDRALGPASPRRR
jgi:dienelactone hydrolase